MAKRCGRDLHLFDHGSTDRPFVVFATQLIEGSAMELVFSLVMLLVAGGVWLVFLRTVPKHSGSGVIVHKTYKPPGVYTQHHSGDRQGFRQPTYIPIAEGYVVEIKTTVADEHFLAALNSTEAQWYEVGTQVDFEYQRRGIPGVWQRTYVTAVKPAADSQSETNDGIDD